MSTKQAVMRRSTSRESLGSVASSTASRGRPRGPPLRSPGRPGYSTPPNIRAPKGTSLGTPADMQRELQSLRHENTELQQSNNQLQSELRSKTSQLAQLENSAEVATLKKKVETLEEELRMTTIFKDGKEDGSITSEFHNQLSYYQEEVRKERESNSQLEAQLKELGDQVSTLSSTLDERDRELELKTTELSQVQLKLRRAEEGGVRTPEPPSMGAAGAMMGRSTPQSSELQTAVARLSDDKRELTAKLAEVEARLKKFENQDQDLVQYTDTLEEKIRSLEGEVERLQGKLRESAVAAPMGNNTVGTSEEVHVEKVARERAERRIVELENEMAEMRQQVPSNEVHGKREQDEIRIVELEKALSEAEGKANRLEQELTIALSRVDILQTELEQLQAKSAAEPVVSMGPLKKEAMLSNAPSNAQDSRRSPEGSESKMSFEDFFGSAGAANIEQPVAETPVFGSSQQESPIQQNGVIANEVSQPKGLTASPMVSSSQGHGGIVGEPLIEELKEKIEELVSDRIILSMKVLSLQVMEKTAKEWEEKYRYLEREKQDVQKAVVALKANISSGDKNIEKKIDQLISSYAKEDKESKKKEMESSRESEKKLAAVERDLFERDRDIAELRNQVADLQSKNFSLMRDAEEKASSMDNVMALQEKEDEIKNTRKEYQKMEMKVAEVEENLNEAQKASQKLEMKAAQLMEEKKEVEDQLDSIRANASAAMDERVKELEAKLHQAEEEAQSSRSEIEGRLNAKQEEIFVIEKKLSESVNECRHFSDELDNAGKTIVELNEAIDALKLRADAYDELEERLKEMQGTNSELLKSKVEFDDLKGNIEKANHKYKEEVLAQVDEQIKTLSAAKFRAERELEEKEKALELVEKDLATARYEADSRKDAVAEMEIKVKEITLVAAKERKRAQSRSEVAQIQDSLTSSQGNIGGEHGEDVESADEEPALDTGRLKSDRDREIQEYIALGKEAKALGVFTPSEHRNKVEELLAAKENAETQLAQLNSELDIIKQQASLVLVALDEENTALRKELSEMNRKGDSVTRASPSPQKHEERPRLSIDDLLGGSPQYPTMEGLQTGQVVVARTDEELKGMVERGELEGLREVNLVKKALSALADCISAEMVGAGSPRTRIDATGKRQSLAADEILLKTSDVNYMKNHLDFASEQTDALEESILKNALVLMDLSRENAQHTVLIEKFEAEAQEKANDLERLMENMAQSFSGIKSSLEPKSLGHPTSAEPTSKLEMHSFNTTPNIPGKGANSRIISSRDFGMAASASGLLLVSEPESTKAQNKREEFNSPKESTSPSILKVPGGVTNEPAYTDLKRMLNTSSENERATRHTTGGDKELPVTSGDGEVGGVEPNPTSHTSDALTDANPLTKGTGQGNESPVIESRLPHLRPRFQQKSVYETFSRMKEEARQRSSSTKGFRASGGDMFGSSDTDVSTSNSRIGDTQGSNKAVTLSEQQVPMQGGLKPLTSSTRRYSESPQVPNWDPFASNSLDRTHATVSSPGVPAAKQGPPSSFDVYAGLSKSSKGDGHLGGSSLEAALERANRMNAEYW